MIDPQNFVLATVNELFFLPDKFIESSVLWLLLALLILGLALLVFYVISLPLRRQERDRFLLDVIESALAQGEQVERYIISLAQTRDRSPGIQFHLLAAHLETGCSFVDALEKTPRLFPPQLLAMLKVGESIGDLRKVLPACRKLLRDGISQSRAAINYQVVFAFVLNPMVLLAVPFLAVKIMPVFGEIFSGFGMKFSSLATTATMPLSSEPRTMTSALVTSNDCGKAGRSMRRAARGRGWPLGRRTMTNRTSVGAT